MSELFRIYRKELYSFFVVPSSYVIISAYILLSGFLFFNILGNFNLELIETVALPEGTTHKVPNLNEGVVLGYYHSILVILLFAIPLLGMRSFAEEKRQGSLEVLLSTPVSVKTLVLGKFIGVFTISLFLVLLSSIFPFMLIMFGDPEILPILSGLLGLVLATAAFVSIAVAASSLSESQTVAGMSAIVILLMLYIIHSPAESLSVAAADTLRHLSSMWQVRDLFLGVVSLKSVVYFASLACFGLVVSVNALESYRSR